MASKLGFILSLIFVIQLLLMTGDIAIIQAKQTQLQAFATTIGQRISLEGGLNQTMVDWATDEGFFLTCLSNCQPQFGDTLTYRLEVVVTPLIISNNPMSLRIVRHAVIGIYY
jgi:hypothetical protein